MVGLLLINMLKSICEEAVATKPDILSRNLPGGTKLETPLDYLMVGI